MREDTYITKTLNLAAYLYASGLKLANSTRRNNEVFFEFSPRNQAEQLVEKYFSGTATIDPRELFACLNDLRDLIFSGGNKS